MTEQVKPRQFRYLPIEVTKGDRLRSRIATRYDSVVRNRRTLLGTSASRIPGVAAFIYSGIVVKACCSAVPKPAHRSRRPPRDRAFHPC